MKRAALVLALACCAAAALFAATPSKSGWAVAVLPSGAEFTVEVLTDPASQARGYMFREHVGPREGMLFVFEKSDLHSFWMMNCLVSLDIVWLDDDHRVVYVAENQHPCPKEGDCPSVVSLLPARYVLEFAAGTAKAQGLKVGDQVVVLSSGDGP